MTEPPTSVLPEAFAHAVRLAPVPLELRTLLQHLGPWSLDVRLPSDPAAMSLALRQLLKLALLPSDAVQLSSVGVADDACDVALTVSRGGPSVVLGLEDLGQDLRVLVRRLSAELADPTDLVQVSEALALTLAREQTVRKLSSRMLQAEDLDEALYAMLLGITSGYGASFHRAALFAYDEMSRTFRGSIAIGPRDEREAHRVWEAIETEDKTLDQALDDYKTLEGTGDFQQFVRTLALAETEGDELSTALAAGSPQVFRHPPKNRTLAQLLAPATEYVISVIQPRGSRLGLIVADNAYGRQPIHDAQVESLRALADPTSLVWDIRSLLRKVDALARHDALTGLCNRREFEERLAVEYSRCARVRGRSRSRSSTSTTSSRSTTRTGTPPATSCCSGSARSSGRRCASTTSRRATAATSSRSCSPTAPSPSASPSRPASAAWREARGSRSASEERRGRATAPTRPRSSAWPTRSSTPRRTRDGAACASRGRSR